MERVRKKKSDIEREIKYDSVYVYVCVTESRR